MRSGMDDVSGSVEGGGMRRLSYNTRKQNECDYCTECKNQYFCKHEKCIYKPEPKKYSGYPWQAVLARRV